jgi:anti-sigma factor RsiW
MNRHVSAEQLSAYLDAELGYSEIRQIENHCSSCKECGERLDSMQRVVSGLGRLGRATPPPVLRQQIRQQIAVQPPAPRFDRALNAFCLLFFPPIRPALRTAAVMGLALVMGVVGLLHESEVPAPRPGQEVVTVEPGAQLGQILTTSEVAGREFIWTDDGWIQKGLVGQTPVARMDAGSPQGRALLTRYSDLELLLEDGSPVVLRYDLETVEIRNLPPNRVIGFEPQPVHKTVRRTHGSTVAA